MPIMPSHAFVAKALHSVGADADWDEVSLEEQTAHMQLAKVAISAITSWQRQHQPDGSNRYRIEPTSGDEEGYDLLDRTQGLSASLGVIYDALLAQQIVDALNRPRVPDQMPQMPKGPVYGE